MAIGTALVFCTLLVLMYLSPELRKGVGSLVGAIVATAIIILVGISLSSAVKEYSKMEFSTPAAQDGFVNYTLISPNGRKYRLTVPATVTPAEIDEVFSQIAKQGGH
jgi:hypothetical protein